MENLRKDLAHADYLSSQAKYLFMHESGICIKDDLFDFFETQQEWKPRPAQGPYAPEKLNFPTFHAM